MLCTVSTEHHLLEARLNRTAYMRAKETWRSSSKYGSCVRTRTQGKWAAQVRNGRSLALGTYASEIAAAKAVSKYAQ